MKEKKNKVGNHLVANKCVLIMFEIKIILTNTKMQKVVKLSWWKQNGPSLMVES